MVSLATLAIEDIDPEIMNLARTLGPQTQNPEKRALVEKKQVSLVATIRALKIDR
jgi:hypothetical protein